MARHHGVGTRGLDLSPKSVLYEGRFGRIFRSLPAADFGDDEAENIAHLASLAAKMVSGPDGVKDGEDDEESGIPAAFTYLGQFVDHDLTFDPVSSLQKQNDPDALVDFRSPAFDLDCIYGRGPNDQPYLYEPDGVRFALGDAMTGRVLGANINAHDLPRLTSARRAVIGDPRNDENVIVSQLQGLFHRFHNRVVVEEGVPFQEAQRIVRFHYQWVLFQDFLPRIIAARVLHRILPHIERHSDVATDPPHLRFYHARCSTFMPLEFSAAAYRLGHSMVRPGYRLNDDVLQPIFPFVGSGGDSQPDIPGPGLTGFGAFPPGWAMDWARFVDTQGRSEDGTQRLQLAYRLDASLVAPLGGLPIPVTSDAAPLNSLAARNLVRGWRMRLPSGQAIARAMGVVPLADDQILLGKELDDDDPENPRTPVARIDPVFADNCPLWAYILAEAAQEYRAHGTKLTVHLSDGHTRKVGTPQLGDVGGTIVAETFAGIMLKDANSFWNLHPKFKPFLHIPAAQRAQWRLHPNVQAHPFGLRELVAYALGDGI